MSSVAEIFIIGLVLSADSFSAAVAMGLRPFSKNDAIKFAISSALAEALFALLGALAGAHVVRQFSAIDHWVAFVLLIVVALHMAYEGLTHLLNRNQKVEVLSFYSFTKILIVSFATSLDAFSVGMGLGIAKKPLLPFVVSIGAWAFLATLAGLYLAKTLSKKLGPILNLIGSVVLGILAFQMLKI